MGSRVDRLAQVGRGETGLESFRLLINDRRFRDMPMILETPRAGAMGAVHLAALGGLIGASRAKEP